MKHKIFRMFFFLMLTFFCGTGYVLAQATNPSGASAAPPALQKIIDGLSNGKDKEVIDEQFSFGGPRIWIIIAAMLIAVNIVGLASDIGKELGGAQLGGSVGNSSLTLTTGAAAFAVGKVAPAVGKDIKKLGKKMADGFSSGGQKSAPSAGSNNYKDQQSGSGGGSGGGALQQETANNNANQQTPADNNTNQQTPAENQQVAADNNTENTQTSDGINPSGGGYSLAQNASAVIGSGIAITVGALNKGVQSTAAVANATTEDTPVGVSVPRTNTASKPQMPGRGTSGATAPKTTSASATASQTTPKGASPASPLSAKKDLAGAASGVNNPIAAATTATNALNDTNTVSSFLDDKIDRKIEPVRQTANEALSEAKKAQKS